jgi:uncharacterized protein (TIGR02996 family)
MAENAPVMRRVGGGVREASERQTGRSDAVTTEDDFAAALDANPEDWQTRLVYADWLQERCDERAEGYRALGSLRRFPACWAASDRRPYLLWGWLARSRTDTEAEEILPDDWYALIVRNEHDAAYAAERRTRREAEDDVVTAFLKLPSERRTELLAASPMKGRRTK